MEGGRICDKMLSTYNQRENIYKYCQNSGMLDSLVQAVAAKVGDTFLIFLFDEGRSCSESSPSKKGAFHLSKEDLS